MANWRNELLSKVDLEMPCDVGVGSSGWRPTEERAPPALRASPRAFAEVDFRRRDKRRWWRAQPCLPLACPRNSGTSPWCGDSPERDSLGGI